MATGGSGRTSALPTVLSLIAVALAVASLVVVFVVAPTHIGAAGSPGTPGSTGPQGPSGQNGTTLPLVTVEWVSVNFTDPAMGTNETLFGTYSVPTGATTWVRFDLNLTNVSAGYGYAPNNPWVGLGRYDETVGGTVVDEIILGAPRSVGSYPIILTVTPK